MLARYGRAIPLALAYFALSSAGSVALAQGNVFNPYGNSGFADYREFTTPMSSNDPSLPGQARLQNEAIGGRNRANQFESYVNSLGGRDAELTEGTRNGRAAAGPGVPYYQAFRQYDEQYKRVYRPNDSRANRDFDERLKRRNAAYAQALAEKDPIKRTRLLRQIEQISPPDRPASSRAAAATTTRAARAPATPAATPRARTPARPARPAAPAASTPGPASDPSTVPIPPPR